VLIVDGWTDLALTREIAEPYVTGASFAVVAVEQKTRSERERLFETILSVAFIAT
jgi:hypothetical protein